MTRKQVCSTFAALFAAAAFAQDPSAKQVLEKVRTAYTGVRRFEIAGNIEMLNRSFPLRLAVEYPDKLRLEGSMGALTPGAQPGGVRVADGSVTSEYDAARNVYTRHAGPPAIDLDMSDDELKQAGIQPSSPIVVKFGELTLAGFRRLAELGDRATLVRTESRNNAECYVIGAQQGPSKALLWIDKKQYRILRMEVGEGDQSIRMNFTTVSLNEPLPEGVFTFVPPDGARQVDTLDR